MKNRISTFKVPFQSSLKNITLLFDGILMKMKVIKIELSNSKTLTQSHLDHSSPPLEGLGEVFKTATTNESQLHLPTLDDHLGTAVQLKS